MKRETEAKARLICPECGKRMITGVDLISKDYYAKCTNNACSSDGWYAGSLDELIAGQRVILTPMNATKGE